MPIMSKNGSILVRPSGGILATDCAGGGGGDIYIPPGSCVQNCDELRREYSISISGIPAICLADAFNGVWTVTWLQNCLWTGVIDEYREIFLSLANPWSVSMRINVSGGYGFEFGAFEPIGDPDSCLPDEFLWEAWDCFVPSGCSGLCNGFYENGACVVSIP